MISPLNLLVIAASAVALSGMMLTNPDYNRALQPFVTDVPFGEPGQTRLIIARFDGWRSADQVSFTQFGTDQTRDSEGVFLIADLVLSGTTRSTRVDASWIGASGREYAATRRISGVEGQLDDLWLQPGLESRASAYFELPADEIEGGALRLSLPLDPDLDGTLRLAAPDGTPPHQPDLRLGR